MERRTEIDDALAAWLRDKAAKAAAAELVKAGIRAAALATSLDLVNDDHLRERSFWEPDAAGALPGLQWRASFAQTTGPAPKLGADTEIVLRDVLGMSSDKISALRQADALG